MFHKHDFEEIDRQFGYRILNSQGFTLEEPCKKELNNEWTCITFKCKKSGCLAFKQTFLQGHVQKHTPIPDVWVRGEEEMSHMTSGLFTSASQHYATPVALFVALDAEFHFNDDPCPLEPLTSGLSRAWGTSTFCNCPYGRETGKWVEKAHRESLLGKTVVMLLASRTDVPWWHNYVMKAAEIRFLRGRLHFNGLKINAPFPFPSVVVVFKEKR